MTTNPSPPDWRGLCEELVEALDGWHKAVFETGTGWVRPDETYLIDRARAALAQPGAEVVGPTDDELRELAAAEMDNAPNWEEPEYSYEAGDPFPYEAPGVAWVNFARAVLARYGHQPAPLPAEGEVGELVEFLRIYGDEVMDEYGDVGEHDQLTRAADLLEQRHPTPVPVSERPWECEGWCDDEDRCWCMSSLDGPPPRWWLVRPEPLSDGWVLPFTVLPLPATTHDTESND